MECIVHLRNPEKHVFQKRIVDSTAKRLIIKAGRRGAKTVSFALKGLKAFLAGKRVLYAAPTGEQTGAFWYEINRALAIPINAGALRKNEAEQYIEAPGTQNRIKAKTAWNANTLRGDFADLLLLDEFQLMAEDAWSEVGEPMLIDHNGDACIAFTPPSLHSSGVSKANDPRHASKLFKKAQADTSGLWEAIHFTSHDNPFVSTEGLATIAQNMSLDSYRREILAEDDEIEASWLVHSKFNDTLCKIKRFEIPKNWDIYSGHDFGSANPAALFIARVKLPLPNGAPNYMRLNDLVIFKEYAPGAGFSTIQHVNKFKELTLGYNVVKRVGGNVTTEDEIRQGYGAHGWAIQPPQLAKVNAQLDRVIALEELNKLYVFDDLYGLISQLANCMWVLLDNKPTNKIKDEQLYHLLACLRYIGSEFVPETVNRSQRNTLVVWG